MNNGIAHANCYPENFPILLIILIRSYNTGDTFKIITHYQQNNLALIQIGAYLNLGVVQEHGPTQFYRLI